jgi:hypothetical protein
MATRGTPPLTRRTFGPDYSEDLDGERISRQHETIRDLMLGGPWRTLGEIALALNYPEASVSAQLRHLRKERFGSFIVEKRRRATGGTWEYHVQPPRPIGPSTQGDLF